MPLNVFDNMVRWKIFGPNREVVKGGGGGGGD
jgi:hypothetical protein